MVAGAGSVRHMSHALSRDYLEIQMSTIEKHLKVCILVSVVHQFTLICHIHISTVMVIFIFSSYNFKSSHFRFFFLYMLLVHLIRSACTLLIYALVNQHK